MNEVPIPASDDVGQIIQRFEALYDVPAYVRRAQRVQLLYDQLVARCRKQRDEWLTMVRIRLGMLQALAGAWTALRPHVVDDDQLRLLAELAATLQPQLRVPVEPTSSARALRQALAELHDSIARFNQRWDAFLRGVDVTEVNEGRTGYNRYYVLEKECALRSSVVARHGFQPLPALTVEELFVVLPLLPVPQLAR
jgi:hypothetical protein